MSFFGLTDLGPQNPFEQCQEIPLHAFEDKDFEHAFQKHQINGCVAYEQMSKVIDSLYHCPKDTHAPNNITEKILNKLSGAEIIDFNSYIAAIAVLKEESEQNEGFLEKACEFQSCGEYRDALQKHTRMSKNPNDKYDKPLTTSQELGWKNATDLPPRIPKNSCEETKYASAMIKAGMYYY